MANIQSQPSNYVEYKLYSEIFPPLLIDEPIGWQDDELELDRHKTYKGIFFTFTGELKFFGEAKDYIELVYKNLGVTAKLLLVRRTLQDDGTDVKFAFSYSAFADYHTMKSDESTVTLNLNSYDLAQTLKSHESDDVELERTTDIKGIDIEAMDENTFTLQGRQLSYVGEHTLFFGDVGEDGFFEIPPGADTARYDSAGSGYTPKTRLISGSGNSRNASVDAFLANDYQDQTAGHMFYVARTLDESQEPATVGFSWDTSFRIYTNNDNFEFTIAKYVWNENTNEYNYVTVLYREDNLRGYGQLHNFSGYHSENLEWNEGLSLRIRRTGSDRKFDVEFFKLNMKVDSVEYWSPTPNVKFAFNHDIGERLAYVLTGNQNSFYSSIFGRKDHPRINYPIDGKWAGVAWTSGLWIRGMTPEFTDYKSLTTNFKTWFEDNEAVFNVGIGIDNVGNQERVRCEDLKYFFQDEVVIRLPNQISNVKRTVDTSLFFSGVETGYTKGGDFNDDTMGLDEPNIKVSRISPIDNTESKFLKESKTRADQYAIEETRRKPFSLYPEETTQRDEANWWIDLKRVVGSTVLFEETEWYDRLVSLPTGVLNPESFRSMLFTPLTILRRHGWVLRAGLEKFLDKFLTYGSATSNTNLTMQFKEDDKEYMEGIPNFPIEDLEPSKFLPEEIEFNHIVNEELMALILDYTEVEYNGVIEKVRNYYFKFEWLNEKGTWERGYLTNLKPKEKGKWTMLKSNEGEQLFGVIEYPIVQFNTSTSATECDSGIVDFPDILYFKGSTLTPQIGDTVFTDIGLTTLFVSGSAMMYTLIGLKTDENGKAISFTCN